VQRATAQSITGNFRDYDVVEVYIYLVVHRKPYFGYLDFQTAIRAKLVTYAIFGLSGPYNN
jgi:hypothetical protein